MKLQAKRIKRHMVRTYEFWQMNLRLLVIAEDQKKLLEDFSAKLPPSDSGYLAFSYLDKDLRIAFLGVADDENDEYEFFDAKEIVNIPASAVPNLLVRIVKLNEQLAENAFIQQVLQDQANNALAMSTLTIRALDSRRDPQLPTRLKAWRIEDEERITELIELQALRQSALEEAKEQAAAAAKKDKKTKKKDQEPAEETGEEADEDDEEPEGIYADNSLSPEINISDELAKALQELWIYDLTPANNKSWRAKLEADLPASKLKAGDLVPVELRFVELDGEEIALVFVVPEAQVEDVKIEVSSYRANRLPWRKAYELECLTNHDFHETYYLGRNGEDSKLFNKIIADIRYGRLDPAMYLDLVQKDDACLDFSRELYRCRHCGDLHVTRRLRLVTEDSSMSEPYYCPKCGERSSYVKRVHIASLNCPKCHRPLDMKPEKVWYASDEEDDSILLED
ncbi:MAG: hypothetical protein GX034_02205 [Clostridiaceae bacterium]|nr:hypothetical protein [Clostridiaceae bacterium]